VCGYGVDESKHVSGLPRFPRDSGKKRRWNIFDDIPWDKLDITHTRDATAQRIELYCSEELYIPDYASRSLELRSGSCRDVAMLKIEAGRSLGMATRFVSGTCTSQVMRNHMPAVVTRTPGPKSICPAPVGLISIPPMASLESRPHSCRGGARPAPGNTAPWYLDGVPSDYLGRKVDVAVKSVAAESEIATPNLAPRVKSGW
jgi:hypothetical protein